MMAVVKKKLPKSTWLRAKKINASKSRVSEWSEITQLPLTPYLYGVPRWRNTTKKTREERADYLSKYSDQSDDWQTLINGN